LVARAHRSSRTVAVLQGAVRLMAEVATAAVVATPLLQTAVAAEAVVVATCPMVMSVAVAMEFLLAADAVEGFLLPTTVIRVVVVVVAMPPLARVIATLPQAAAKVAVAATRPTALAVATEGAVFQQGPAPAAGGPGVGDLGVDR